MFPGSDCLKGDWSGAVTVLLHNQPLVLLPQAPASSILVALNTSLHSVDNPVLDKISSVIKPMKRLEVN